MGSLKVPLNDEPRDDKHSVEALWQLVKLARSSGLQQEAAFRERKERINIEGTTLTLARDVRVL